LGTGDELYAGVERIWNGPDRGMIARLVAAFKRRLELVVAVHGKSTSQSLSSGSRGPRPQVIGTAEAQVFTADDDEAIIDWVEANGHQWQKLTAAFLFQQKLNDEWEQARVSTSWSGGTFSNTPEKDAEEDGKVVEDDADEDQVEDEPVVTQVPLAGQHSAASTVAKPSSRDSSTTSSWAASRRSGTRCRKSSRKAESDPATAGPGKGVEEEAWAAEKGESMMPGGTRIIDRDRGQQEVRRIPSTRG
jgi:hypothetical protein